MATSPSSPTKRALLVPLERRLRAPRRRPRTAAAPDAHDVDDDDRDEHDREGHDRENDAHALESVGAAHPADTGRVEGNRDRHAEEAEVEEDDHDDRGPGTRAVTV